MIQDIMVDLDIDIGYLNVNKLAYTFESIYNSNDESLRLVAINSATKALKIMDRYQALHPSYEQMISYLAHEQTSFNSEWAASIKRSSEDQIDKYTHHLHSLQDTEKTLIIEDIQKLAVIYMIQGSYLLLSALLSQFNSLLQFQSQPHDLNQFIENRYIQFNLIQYSLNLYNLMWFPSNNDSSSSGSNSNSNTFKTINNVFKKISVYYRKNEMLVNMNNSNKETLYYWLANWLHLTAYFKQGKFDVFLQEFNNLVNNPSSIPMDILNNDEIGLKTEILIMFKISILITKPYKSLSLLNYQCGIDSDSEILFELFGDNNTFEVTVQEILLNLAESRFKEFKTSFNDYSFTSKLVGTLGYAFPSNAYDFIRFINSLVDFKSFLLTISITKKIPRSYLISILGYSNDYISNDLLLFISSLHLGELGIGYDYHNDYFYNSGEKQNNLDEQIEDLNNRVTGESIANLIKGCLFDQAFNS